MQRSSRLLRNGLLSVAALMLLIAPVLLAAATRDTLSPFTNGTVANAATVNANFVTLANAIDATAATVPPVDGGSNWVRIGDMQWAWGSACNSNGDVDQTITLPQPYNGSYVATVMRDAVDDSGYRSDYAVKSRSAGSFVFHSPAGTGTTNCFEWATIGKWR